MHFSVCLLGTSHLVTERRTGCSLNFSGRFLVRHWSRTLSWAWVLGVLPHPLGELGRVYIICLTPKSAWSMGVRSAPMSTGEVGQCFSYLLNSQECLCTEREWVWIFVVDCLSRLNYLFINRFININVKGGVKAKATLIYSVLLLIHLAKISDLFKAEFSDGLKKSLAVWDFFFLWGFCSLS